MRKSTAICFALFLIGVLVFLAQLWVAPWPDILFFKIMVTDGALLVISLIYVFQLREGRQSDRIKHGSGLD